MSCEGCYAGKIFCIFHVQGSVAINSCPCGDCIVKMICSEPCEEYVTHAEDTEAWSKIK